MTTGPSLVLMAALVGQLASATPAPLRASRGMVATSDGRASAAGLAMLRKGGTAVDAAVAATLAIGVVEPFSAGIGGGGFALHYSAAEQAVRALDFRERAPLGATRDMYLDGHGKIRSNASTEGYLAVAVPGTVAGLAALHQQGGKLPWKDVVAPAVDLAENGFTVSPKLHDVLVQMAPALRRFPESSRTFLKAGQPYDAGDLLFQRDLAETLRAIAQDGPAAFYAGDVARALATDMEDHGGLVTMDDLTAYQPVWRLPLSGTFRGHTVVGFPPPSSGGVHLLQMLQTLDRVDLVALGLGSSAYDHVLVESMRRAYADRARWLGDPAFVDVPVMGLLNPDYLSARWSSFSAQRVRPSAQLPAGDPWPFEHVAQPARGAVPSPAAPADPAHTAHISVVDAQLNAVALTFTINTRMGSAVTVAGTGILLNNEMDDFSSAPGVPNAFGLVGGEANAIAPTKVPLSSMTPTLVFRGAAATTPLTPPLPQAPRLGLGRDAKLRLAVGAPGGSTIITTVLQVILNTVVFGMDVRAAISQPRIHHQWLPDVVRVEEHGMPTDVRRGMFARGHTLKVTAPWGNGTAVEVEPQGVLAGASDPRGEGEPAGH